jgi:signal transduction histidine kinase
MDDIEKFYCLVTNASMATQYIFDMKIVDFICPYGVIALVVAARYLYGISKRPVQLQNLHCNLYLYLKRMNIFDICSTWLYPVDILDEDWSRNSNTPNLLELTIIQSPSDVTAIVERAENIFTNWLKLPDLRIFLRVISELCSNVYEHSKDNCGCILIQKYQLTSQEQVVVRLAVGDIGCGIRQSLVSRYGKIGCEPLESLREALSGQVTARSTGRGGLGLRTVEDYATFTGGYLWIRSETAAILTRGTCKSRGYRQQLVNFPGTQIAVEFRAPLQN